MKSWSFAFNITEQQYFPAHYITLIIGSPAEGLFLCFYKRSQVERMHPRAGIGEKLHSLFTSSASNLEHGAQILYRKKHIVLKPFCMGL